MSILSTDLISHYKASRPFIVESMNSVIERNYEKIMKIWKKTKNPVPLKKAKKIVVGNRDYYYIMSIYVGNSKNLEWDSLIYSFVDSKEVSSIFNYDKDLIFFTDPDFDIPNENLNGVIKYTSRFLEMYGYCYGQKDWTVYDIAERWVRRNSRPVFLVTAEPVEESKPNGSNVLGKDYEEDGICIGRIGEEDPGLVKFIAYYPEEVLQDMDDDESIRNVLDTFDTYVKNISYKNKQDKVKWPDKFMLNKYYNNEEK